MRSASSRAATAISPSSHAPRVATAQGTRLAIGGVADRPAARDFGSLEGSALDDALQDFAVELEAREDLNATAGQRRDLVRKLGRITIEEARACRA